MKIFTCQSCGYGLYFHNYHCNNCGCQLGFNSATLTLDAFSKNEGGAWKKIAQDGGNPFFKPCLNNVQYQACNWVLPADSPDVFCLACQLNRMIPDLGQAQYKTLWQNMQAEKQRLIYSLLRLRLPVISKRVAPAEGLAFDVLADDPVNMRENRQVITGHANGIITINLAEADPAMREKMRQQMGESYRTLLGHLRHESGHYFWQRLINFTDQLQAFRALFGDERGDYNQALNRYYQSGAPQNWSSRFVSSYAASHPWEDWAETWAHYLHMMDTMETAWYLGMGLNTNVGHPSEFNLALPQNPYDITDFRILVAAWIPLTVALNSLNRSMGLPDAYPFVLAPGVIEKLKFIHQVVQATGGRPAGGS